MKKVVYTAIFGGYDNLKEPIVKSEGWDYVCFTDNSELKSDIWKIVHVPVSSEEKRVNTKFARSIKIDPFTVYGLINYDLFVWVDASIKIKCDINDFVNQHHKGDITIMKHPTRICVYQEAEACCRLKKDQEDVIAEQIQMYAQKGMPKLIGMVASGIIIRDNNDFNKKLAKEWLAEVNKYSIRDQLSFNYICWKNKYNYNTMPYEVLYNQMQIEKHLKK